MSTSGLGDLQATNRSYLIIQSALFLESLLYLVLSYVPPYQGTYSSHLSPSPRNKFLHFMAGGRGIKHLVDDLMPWTHFSEASHNPEVEDDPAFRTSELLTSVSWFSEAKVFRSCRSLFNVFSNSRADSRAWSPVPQLSISGLCWRGTGESLSHLRHSFISSCFLCRIMIRFAEANSFQALWHNGISGES